ncbi:MAG: GNAT family N-acetyltransferase [Bacillota bacterium]
MPAQITARYFYPPICPESFATKTRLEKIFAEIAEVHFSAYNTVTDDLSSSVEWFPEEEKLLATIQGTGRAQLLYGKLFINGKQVKGFPPAPRSIQEILSENDITWSSEAYDFAYQQPDRTRWDCKQEDFVLKTYQERLSADLVRVCTLHHPYTNAGSYVQDVWEAPEEAKLKFLKDRLDSKQLVGVGAYYQNKAVAFIEAFNLDLAARLGFPVYSTKAGLLITCLTVQTEVAGYGLGSKLVENLKEEASRQDYRSLQVVAFPDKENWQPYSFYKKHKFKEIKEIDGFSRIMLYEL